MTLDIAIAEENNRRIRILVWIVYLAFFIGYNIAFWNEVVLSSMFFWKLLRSLAGYPLPVLDDRTYLAIFKMMFNNFIGFGLVALVWLLLISSQSILPVSSPREMWRTAWHLTLYTFGLHGPAIFIRGGVLPDTQEDWRRSGPGLLVVDYNSAVVLEEEVPRSCLLSFKTAMMLGALRLMSVFGLADRRKSPRVAGPGLVFTRPRERIRGVVDLRRQTRFSESFNFYTRDGIELSTNAFVVFTVGQNPNNEALQVVYQGSCRPENLRVVNSPNPTEPSFRVESLTDDLDPGDRLEIHQRNLETLRRNALRNYVPLPPLPRWPEFDEHRVFAAIASQARGAKGELVPWGDLPMRVTIAILREIMSQVNYDELYNLDQPGNFGLTGLRRQLSSRLRNSGLLSYRLLVHRRGFPLEAGATYNMEDFRTSEIFPLTGSRILRDRGLRVLMGGFFNPTPVKEEVYQQRLNAWRATWDNEVDLARAGHDLEALRIRNRARAQAQQELTAALVQIFQNGELTQEALGIRIFQALESVAADPKIEKLLPNETVNLMRSLHDWLLPGEKPLAPQPQLPPPGQMPPNQAR